MPSNSWQHGYYADTSYTYGFYRELAPNWMDWVALLKKTEPPATSNRYLELGCGQGLGLCVLAAANPHIQFIGVDFNPEQIAHARSLVRRTGMNNIEFHEADFLNLAGKDRPFDPCDYIVAHGILTWVNKEVRSAIYQIVDKTLTPGGLSYFSYNALPGWLGTHPVQHLMNQLGQRTGINSSTFNTALTALETLQKAGASVFKVQPGLGVRLDHLKKISLADNQNYLFHEYFNASWTLFYFTQIAQEAAEGKLQFVGSATLPENYDTLPDDLCKALDTAPDPTMRELYKDLAVNQAFRRDVFARGIAPSWSGEQQSLLSQRMVTLVQAPDDISLKFSTGVGEVTGRPELYNPLIKEISKGPVSVANLNNALPNMGIGALIQSLSLLAHGDSLRFFQPDADMRAAVHFNRILAELVSRGAPYRYLALAGTGSGMQLDEIGWMALDALNKGENPVSGVEKRLKSLKRSLVKDGKPLPYGKEMAKELTTRLKPFMTVTLPLIKRLGGAS